MRVCIHKKASPTTLNFNGNAAVTRHALLPAVGTIASDRAWWNKSKYNLHETWHAASNAALQHQTLVRRQVKPLRGTANTQPSKPMEYNGLAHATGTAFPVRLTV
jgi:hypothetical protein